MTSETLVLDLRPNHRLLTAAKRYSVPRTSPANHDALTLLFVHSTHTCKEYWEPTIDEFLDIASARGHRGVQEIWAVDSPYHGDTALLNPDKPEMPYSGPFEDWEHWLRAILRHDALCNRRIVLIGHSMGAAVLPLAIIREPRPHNVVASILVEPVALHSVEAWKKLARVLPEGARRRGHRFKSREEALAHFRTLPSWKGYDERIGRIYVDFTFTPLKEGGIASKCSLEREIECYNDMEGLYRVFRSLRPAAQAVPMHITMAEGDRFAGPAFKEGILNGALGPDGKPATVSTILDAEHEVVQQKPREVALHILEAMIGLLDSVHAKL
ncbi:alpha/beta-hydrolase [Schizophyllum commune H4-8]|nr:alpha/beta-hydrolase [Schizophyllum commune H4-8]KAI5893179.1 alpha/beta-hydrolase [Schizophyllum commune H4-8]